MPDVRRLIVLGASNLARGFSTVVNLGRSLWGDPLEVFAAHGHGRSYGIRSRILARSIPGILECALWDQLASAAPAPTRALVTDVGNDIAYDVPVPTIVSWVTECVDRLTALGAEVVLTDLPLTSIERISSIHYEVFRSIAAPSCRLSLREATTHAQELNARLLSLAARRNLKVVRVRREWYGLDPIHIGRAFWARAWWEILLGGDAAPPSVPQPKRPLSRLRLHTAAPHRRWILGSERHRSQPVIRTTGGTSVWLY